MRRFYTRKAGAGERDRVLDVVNFCHKHELFLNDHVYNHTLVGPNGCHLELIVPEGADRTEIGKALDAGYDRHDVVSHAVTTVPGYWLTLNN